MENSFYFKSSNFDNLKKFLFKVATIIMNGDQGFFCRVNFRQAFFEIIDSSLVEDFLQKSAKCI